MTTFPADEVLEAHRRYIAIRERIDAGELRWDALEEMFTDDAIFVDPHWGRIEGLENVKHFWLDSMSGLEDWSFPHEWEAVGGNWLVTGWQNRLPGRRADGSFYQVPGMSRLLYAGNGKFSYEQDLINMVHVAEVMQESGWQLNDRVRHPEKVVRSDSWGP